MNMRWTLFPIKNSDTQSSGVNDSIMLNNVMLLSAYLLILITFNIFSYQFIYQFLPPSYVRHSLYTLINYISLSTVLVLYTTSIFKKRYFAKIIISLIWWLYLIWFLYWIYSLWGVDDFGALALVFLIPFTIFWIFLYWIVPYVHSAYQRNNMLTVYVFVILALILTLVGYLSISGILF